MSFKTIIQSAATAATLLSLAACSGGSSPSNTGQLMLGLTDGPVESATSVVVQFTGIEIKPAGGPPQEAVVFDSASCDEFDPMTGACSIDLLALTGDKRKLVFNGQLEAGNYQWVRLLVNAELNVMDSYIEFKNDPMSMCSLYIPSGAQSGLKIVSGITVTANGVSDYTLDFDVRKSITMPPGLAGPMVSTETCAANYVMKPTIRIVDTTQVGMIVGTVPELLLSTSNCAQNENTMQYENVAAYVFENLDGSATADDIDEDATYPDPVTTASVVFDTDANDYVYEAGFLLSPEDYLVALTCTSDLDLMDVDEFDPGLATPQDFSFIAERTVTTITDAIADGSF
jgi:hypothetical protein